MIRCIFTHAACNCSILSSKVLRSMSGVAMYDFDPDENWFLAQVKPNCVQIAERNLQRQGFRTFLPLEERTKKRRGRFVSALLPMFPGYLFVSLDIARGLWRKINSTNGISRLVSFGQEPRTVPLEIINQLRSRCDIDSKLIPSDALKPGDEVRFTKGPFVDFVSRIEEISPDERAWLLIDIMGSQTRVAARMDHLSPA
jgi:transcriptional antiterminator RfaH